MNKDDRFQGLYRKYYRRVVRFYISVFRVSVEDAEELTQDAFLKFFEAMEEYRGDAEWAYFEEIARNVGYNRIRSLSTAKRSAKIVDIDSPDFANEPASPPVPDYAEQQQTELRSKSLRDAIAELPLGSRQCMQLWLSDFKYDEIAKFMGITMDAVKSRLRDAKKRLRAQLGDGNALPEDDE